MIIGNRIHNISLEIITVVFWFSLWTMLEILLFEKQINPKVTGILFASVIITIILKYFLEVDESCNTNENL